MQGSIDAVLAEIGQAVKGIDEASAERLCGALMKAGRIVVHGCGREKLQLQGFAMRLFHLGLPVSVAGEVTAPPVGPGDLLLACSGPGETSTVLSLMDRAREAGAGVFLLTAQEGGSAAARASDMLVIPAQTMASDQGEARSSVLPMGSLFEGALFVLFELLVLRLAAKMGAGADAMRARHTNLE